MQMNCQVLWITTCSSQSSSRITDEEGQNTDRSRCRENAICDLDSEESESENENGIWILFLIAQTLHGTKTIYWI
jgi:hypothetical protein